MSKPPHTLRSERPEAVGATDRRSVTIDLRWVARAAVLVAIGLSFIALRPVWIARYRGVDADLSQQWLRFAPLAGADLRRANLVVADLSHANLRKARLDETNMMGVYLIRTNLEGASLRGAVIDKPSWFKRANFQNTDLRETQFSDGSCEDVNFTGADLRGATVWGFRFTRANLSGADLRGVDLRGATFEQVTVTDAKYDADTQWPPGFDPQAHGAVLVEARPASE